MKKARTGWWVSKRIYKHIAITSNDVSFSCPDCGAHVTDTDAHDKFHQKIVELSNRSSMGLH